jgi:hypothetical protein
MKQIQTRLRPRDEIDSFVDGLLADPSRADELKADLRRRFRVVAPADQDVDDDSEDLWENVPV